MITGTETTTRLDLLNVGRQHRARRWRDLLDGFYFKSDYSIPSGFQNGRVDGFHFGGFTIGRFASDPIAGLRSKSHIARNPVDAYMVVLTHECPVTMTQGGQVVRVGSKGFTIISAMEPSSFHQLSPGAHESILVPGELMRRHAPRIDDRMAVRFGGEPLHAMFYAMARQWALTAHKMTPVSRELVTKSMVDLLGLAVDRADENSGESVIQSAHRRGIARVIQENYANPALNAAFVAKRVGLSTRRVRSILAARDTTVDRLVRERRVAEGLRLCKFDASPRLSGQALAHAVGYADVRQFYRDMEIIGGHRPSHLER